MPSFKDFEKILPVSGTGESKLASNPMTDAAEGSRKAGFEAALEKADPTKVTSKQDIALAPIESNIGKTGQMSPMGLAAKMTGEVQKAVPSINDLSSQAAKIREQLKSVQESMQKVQKTSFTPEQTTKLHSYIEHIDQSLKEVTSLTKGVEVGSGKVGAIGTDKPPLVRFLSYLTESDKKLNSFMDELGGMRIGEQRLTPDVMMAVQVKLGFITQELEFFTSILNKSLESTKTVMNVQI